MNTPIYDFLKSYMEKSGLRLHMPGHKGRGFSPLIPYGMDITEISGADSLFEADGIIAQSEENASEIFGTVRNLLQCGGLDPLHTGDACNDETGKPQCDSCPECAQEFSCRVCTARHRAAVDISRIFMRNTIRRDTA